MAFKGGPTFPNLHPNTTAAASTSSGIATTSDTGAAAGSGNQGLSDIPLCSASPSVLSGGVAAPNDSKKFKSDQHKSQVLNGLKDLRESGLLADVTLVVDKVQFGAHRAVLASCSAYFRSMFTSEMKESSQNIIEIHGITATGLKEILDYIYTAEVTITVQNIQDVLSAANHLQVRVRFSFL